MEEQSSYFDDMSRKHKEKMYLFIIFGFLT
jgi:hypothetical protein